MKVLSLTLLASVAIAAPQGKGAAPKDNSPMTANEFTKGGCKGSILFFSRGTGEPANLGMLGRGAARELRAVVPDLAVEGVDYPAAVGGNLTPAGADAGGIKKAQQLFRDAAAKCPKSALLGGGYSQGAALMHRAIEALPKNVQDRIAGVVLYGDTKNKQDGGRIKNFPPDKVKIYCNANDGVCGGALMVNAGHMAYNADTHFKPAAQWLSTQIKKLVGDTGAAPAAPEEPVAGGEE